MTQTQIIALSVIIGIFAFYIGKTYGIWTAAKEMKKIDQYIEKRYGKRIIAESIKEIDRIFSKVK